MARSSAGVTSHLASRCGFHRATLRRGPLVQRQVGAELLGDPGYGSKGPMNLKDVLKEFYGEEEILTKSVVLHLLNHRILGSPKRYENMFH